MSGMRSPCVAILRLTLFETRECIRFAVGLLYQERFLATAEILGVLVEQSFEDRFSDILRSYLCLCRMCFRYAEVWCTT